MAVLIDLLGDNEQASGKLDAEKCRLWKAYGNYRREEKRDESE
jgi:hypothetical protein